MRTKREMETVICFNDSEKMATLWTASDKIKATMDKECLNPYRKDGEWRGYKIPKSMIKIK